MVTMPAESSLDELLGQARTMTEAQRKTLADWSVTALRSDRQMAVNAAMETARRLGRAAEQVRAMDAAFQAVARSAGVDDPSSYFADESGVPGDNYQWEPAAEVAAAAAAAIVVEDAIAPEMAELIFEPWRLIGR